MPKVRVNGIELNYVEAGSGEPLLLIMGLGGSSGVGVCGAECPTLVSVAEDDILIPPRFTREMAAAVPKAALRVIERAATPVDGEASRATESGLVVRRPSPDSLSPE